ncbi:LPD7 domain-containing protein [Spirochaeta dissipatitropha]
MLIRIRGGKSGIKEYLQTGRKKGREQSRDQLDNRVILHGDLEAADAIISSVPGKGEKYLHITISFREDRVPLDTLQRISTEFRQFAFAAYRSDEYYYYCEAHLPRIKCEQDQKSGKMLERKPHLHIVIPKVNLLNGKGLNPFGKVKRCIEYIDAFQETMNTKYKLASPKDHRRLETADRSEVISRYSGDFFKPAGRELKQDLLEAALNMNDYEAFICFLNTLGTVRVRNPGTDREYLNIKKPEDVRGVNLKEQVFSRSFLQLSRAEKQSWLQNETISSSVLRDKDASSSIDPEAILKEWNAVGCREIKYLNSGNRSQWKQYQSADTTERKNMLHVLEKAFYSRSIEPELTDLEAENQVTEAISFQETNEALSIQEAAKQAGDSTIGELLRIEARKMKYIEMAAIYRNEYARLIDPGELLNSLSHSHGINPAKYRTEQTGDYKRIQVETGKRYSALDFLVEELYLEPEDALQIIRKVNQEQNRQQNQRQEYDPELWRQFTCERNTASHEAAKAKQNNRYSAAQQRNKLKNEYVARKQKIYAKNNQTIAERKAALSLLNMNKVHRFQEIHTTLQNRNQEIEYRFSRLYNYPAWLHEQAENGDEKSLHELQRLRRWNPLLNENQNAAASTAKNYRGAIYHEEDWSHHITENGSVHYRYREHEALVDHGQRVDFENNCSEVTETGLRLSMMKFGTHLKIYGSDDFKKEVVATAASLKLPLRFTDDWMNEALEKTQPPVRRARPRSNDRGGMEMEF